jgi:hypothetical protein
MSQHLETWINAYLDGELTEKQQQKMEIHLSKCQQCRLDLDEYQNLSSLLQDSPPADGLKSSEQFTAEVNLLLPRQQLVPKSRLPKIIWIIIPVVLLAGFVFLQALALFSDLAALIPGAEGLLTSTFSNPDVDLIIFPWLQTTIREALLWTGNGWLFHWNAITQFFTTTVIGILYVLWLAGWWVRNRQTKAQQTEFDN